MRTRAYFIPIALFSVFSVVALTLMARSTGGANGNGAAMVRIEAISLGRVLGIATVDVPEGGSARFASGALVGEVHFDEGSLFTPGSVTAVYSVNGLATAGEISTPANSVDSASRVHPEGREIRMTVKRVLPHSH